LEIRRFRNLCGSLVVETLGSNGRRRVKSAQVSGTEGYAEEAEELFERYESISAADSHRAVLHLIPTAPGLILDIGSGTGRDAAWFAAMGHRVVAVEPTDAFRLPAMALHPSPRIEWLDDGLPDLALLLARGERFDVVMLTAVWMHLDAQQRRRAMPNVASLVREGGAVILQIRHGPVPAGRRMFEVSPEETIELAQAQGLHPVLNLRTESSQDQNRVAGVTWTSLAFVKGKNERPPPKRKR
jgi:SAM-dependent methyltransferase